ncbi:MAG: hypothetical protein R3F30_04145 [Planctomycetota bacterium]
MGNEAANPTGPTTTRRPAGARALGLWLAVAAAYLLLLQRHPYGDGITYVDYVLDGKLWYHHLAYLPSLWGFVGLAGLVGVEPRTACFAFSALAGAGAVAVLYHLLATARTFRGRWPPLPTALLLATAPSVLFFSTQVENHAWHLFWATVVLWTLDRALAGLRLWPWLPAGAAVVLAYASHSSFLLLCPALALLVRLHWAGGLLRPLGAAELLRLLLLFGPTVLFKLLVEPAVKAASGGAAFGQDTSLAFALSLWEWRGLTWWLDYLPGEVLLPAFGALARGRRAARPRAGPTPLRRPRRRLARARRAVRLLARARARRALPRPAPARARPARPRRPRRGGRGPAPAAVPRPGPVRAGRRAGRRRRRGGPRLGPQPRRALGRRCGAGADRAGGDDGALRRRRRAPAPEARPGARLAAAGQLGT